MPTADFGIHWTTFACLFVPRFQEPRLLRSSFRFLSNHSSFHYNNLYYICHALKSCSALRLLHPTFFLLHLISCTTINQSHRIYLTFPPIKRLFSCYPITTIYFLFTLRPRGCILSSFLVLDYQLALPSMGGCN